MRGVSPNILLVSNHRERVQNLDNYLASTGWPYALASDSTTALEALRGSSFDVVIADVDFSDDEGHSLFHMLRKQNPTQAVIVLSSDGSIREAISVLRAGARDFLQYPLDFDTLERSVTDVFSGVRYNEHLQFRHVIRLHKEYQFSSAELAASPFQLDFLEELERLGKLTGDEKLQIKLAFQEAITNSLEHGNLELLSEWKDEFNEVGIDQYSLTKKSRLADPTYADRTVSLTIEYVPDTLRIVIQDQGPGFTAKEPTNLTDGENDILCYGRGRAIIGSAMDFVEYREDGRLIEMRRTLRNQ